MNTIEDLVNDLKAIVPTIEDAVERATIGDSFDIAELNRDQLSKGFDAEGKQLGEYTPTTKKIRAQKGLQTDFIDLKFTGRSYNTIDVKKTGNKTEIVSDPDWDLKRFPNAIGIAPENEDNLTDIITDNIEPELDRLLT